MRKFARIGMTLGAMAALAMATTGTASAAPAFFSVAAVHSAGAGATSTIARGDLSWSSSLRTVQVSNVVVTANANECGDLHISGFQGNTQVTQGYTIPVYVCGVTRSFPDLTLTTTVPGGITHVHVEVIDATHGAIGYGNCHQNEGKCRTSYA